MNSGPICRPAGESSDDDFDGFGDGEPIGTKNLVNSYHARPIDNQELLLTAAYKGDVEGVLTALSKRVRLNEIFPVRYTALMNACHGGNYDIIKILLNKGANPNCTTRDLTSPLMSICFSICEDEVNLLNCLKLLLDSGANIKGCNERGITSLMFACRHGRTSLVTELIQRGSNVNHTDSQGWSALFWAVNQNNIELVKTLVLAGAKKQVLDVNQRTAFDLAQSKKQLEEIAVFLCPKKLRQEFSARDNVWVAPVISDRLFYAHVLAKIDELAVNNCLPRKFVKGDKIPFDTFLTVTDDELKDLGISSMWDRRRTLRYINEYFFYQKIPWMDILGYVPPKYQLNYRELTAIIMYSTDRMKVVISGFLYLRRVLKGNMGNIRGTREIRDMTYRTEVMFSHLLASVIKFQHYVNRLDPTVIITSDFIGPQKKKTWLSGFTSLGSVFLVTGMCSLLYVIKRKF